MSWLMTPCLARCEAQFSITELVVAEVNECELFPELCLYGKCTDTRTSYRCECPLGYTLGPRGVVCKGKYVNYGLGSNLMITLVAT